MNCTTYHDAIANLLDGTLDAAGERDLERHLAACAPCRALLADLKSIQAAAFTLPRLDPPDVLPRIRARLTETAAERAEARVLAWPTSRTALGVWFAAAAALLLVTTVGLWTIVSPDNPPAGTAVAQDGSGQDPVASVQAELQAATAHYERAIQQLEQIARNGDGTLDPQVASVFEQNLQVIDQAIDESRTALRTQPASADVQEGLFDAMRSKVALLQQTVELINEMRKGNQAEAGRLIQGLNQ